MSCAVLYWNEIIANYIIRGKADVGCTDVFLPGYQTSQAYLDDVAESQRIDELAAGIELMVIITPALILLLIIIFSLRNRNRKKRSLRRVH